METNTIDYIPSPGVDFICREKGKFVTKSIDELFATSNIGHLLMPL